jgi:hypothetical protein
VRRAAVFHFIAISGVSIRKTPGNSFFTTAAIHRDEVLALKFTSRREVVGNNLALAR